MQKTQLPFLSEDVDTKPSAFVIWQLMHKTWKKERNKKNINMHVILYGN